MTLVTVTTNSHLIAAAGFEKDDDNYAPYHFAAKNQIDQRTQC